MNNGVKHIIFDLGGVLLNIDLNRISAGFASIMNLNEEQVRRIKFDIVPAYEIGAIGTHEFLASLSAYLKPGYTDKDIISIWNSIIMDLPSERLNMLKELRLRYKVHLLSNINDLHADCFEENFRTAFKTDPRTYFDQYFYSHIIGRRKPDTGTYTWVLDQLQCEPEDVVFIDDMPENIEGARNTGIQAYQLMNQKMDIIQLMTDLNYIHHK
jgi:glucose-1-phosphatase